MLPEMTLIEMLSALRQILDMRSADRKIIIQNIIRYFFTNPVEVSHCPFLCDTACRIYRGRFFGCRAYGLWSPKYYQGIADQSRRAKIFLQKQWQLMNIDLPESVVDYQVPYCRDVELPANVRIDDKTLIESSEQIHRLSMQLSPWHDVFEQTYFSDLSFLISSHLFGINQAVQMKLALVRDIVERNDRSRLQTVLNELPHSVFERLE
jgi:hypothetical protein